MTLPSSEILARIPIPGRPDQELHLRRRRIGSREEVPLMYDWSVYNTQGAGHVMACAFPISAELLDAMIEAMQTERAAL